MPELNIDLYRGIKSSSIDKKKENRDAVFAARDGQGSLYPRPNVDVTTYQSANGIELVRGVEDRDEDGKNFVDEEEGISVSATLGTLGFLGWCYFTLPKGTVIPNGIDVRKTPTNRDPEHHSIRCVNSMTIDAFRGALDNFARSAIAKSVEEKRAVLHHSASN